MKQQRLYGQVRQAVDDYQMISDGDVIAVGISGGKDSLALLYALCGLQHFYPASFSLFPIYVDLGFPVDGEDFGPVEKFCAKLGAPLNIVKTSIGPIVFETRREPRPCSLCSRMRKGALNQRALDLGCNKVAYGHNREDVVETMLMSLIFESTFYSFPPVTHLDGTELDVIRPLIYVREADLIGFRNQYHLPVWKNPCPADGNTKREYAKNLLKQIDRENPGAAGRLFQAVTRADLPDWPPRHRSADERNA